MGAEVSSLSASLSDLDARLNAARIRRAELVAYGRNNAALAALHKHIDRILEERLDISRKLNAELESAILPDGPGE